jgi:endo-1,4-beta-mannosidase
VIAAASRRGQKLVLSITGQGEGCDDGRWKDLEWYSGGYRTKLNLDSRTRVTTSYWDYTREIVTRYRTSPVVGMWELVGEPEVSAAGTHACADHSQASVALRKFFDDVGGEVKRLDPNHLIHSGVIGSGQCGTSGEHYTYVHQSPAIDVASYHDYGADSVAVPGDQWNGMKVRIDAMRGIGKPLVVSEVGIKAQRGLLGCGSLESRSALLRTKATAQLAAGAAGFMPWNWMPTNDGSCSYETVTTGDPVLSMLKTVAL